MSVYSAQIYSKDWYWYGCPAGVTLQPSSKQLYSCYVYSWIPIRTSSTKCL